MADDGAEVLRKGTKRIVIALCRRGEPEVRVDEGLTGAYFEPVDEAQK